MQLPNSWNNDGAYEQQVDFSANNLVLTCVQLPENRFNYTSVRAREPFVHPAVAERQYFEVEIKQKKGSVRVGLSQPGFCLHDPCTTVGFAPGSYGINGLGGISVSGHYKVAPDGDYSVTFEAGDVIGCGVRAKQEDPAKKEVFFTRNGQLFGDPVDLPMFATGGTPMLLYPTVTLKGIGTEIEGIFGDDPANRPFRYSGN